MGGMSTRNEIKARLGILAEPPAKAKATMAVNIGGARSRQKIVGGTWLKGTWDGGTWGALVFPEPSESYGIPEFPYISKLYMNPAGKPGFNDVVVNYDRGWDVKPSTPALQKAFQEIGRAVTAQVKSSSSRPGAKAKMDKNADYVEYANLRETLSKLENRVRRAQGEERARLQRELDAGTKRFRELGNRLRASRPGAKAKMGYRVGEKVQDKHTGQMAMIGEVLPVNAPENIQRRKQLDRLEPEYRLVDPTTGKHLGYAKEHRLLRASRPGAKATHAAADKPGRKVMAESDPAVSAKIRKLMAEGKPQKQAVAIALDMKRRGEI